LCWAFSQLLTDQLNAISICKISEITEKASSKPINGTVSGSRLAALRSDISIRAPSGGAACVSRSSAPTASLLIGSEATVRFRGGTGILATPFFVSGISLYTVPNPLDVN
jgi:hypothetical protein